MALQIISTGDGMMAIGSDAATGERGILMKMQNASGGASVKGTVVHIADEESGYDNDSVEAQTSGYDPIGVIQEAGVADGDHMWIWLNGSIAEVLWKDETASTKGYVALADNVDGRASDIAVPSANPVQAEHFREIGHTMSSQDDAQADSLVLVHIHFN